MTWTGTFTYEGDLATDQLQRLRWLVGDTDSSSPYLYDEEYAPYVHDMTISSPAIESDHYIRAAKVADLIAGRLVNQAQRISAGGTSVDWGDRAERFRMLAESLRDAGATGSSAVPYAGGISWSDRLARESDTDRVAPYFDREPPRRVPPQESYWR